MNIQKKIAAITRHTSKSNTLFHPYTDVIGSISKGCKTPYNLAMLNLAYKQVKEGTYSKLKNFHYGVEHISKSIDGSLYYKGLHIAHFSYYKREWREEWEATISAAKICKLLEDKGLSIKFSPFLLVTQHLTPEEIAACTNVEAEITEQMELCLTALKNKKLLKRLNARAK